MLNNPPAKLCSCGSATLATKRDPPANILRQSMSIKNDQTTRRAQRDVRGTHKSAPKTEATAAGKPKVQYGESVFISANRHGAIDVITQPVTM